VSVTDTSEIAASIAKRWLDARQKKTNDLMAIEGKVNFEGLQQFLSTVHALTSEGWLRRYVYVAQKPGESVTREV